MKNKKRFKGLLILLVLMLSISAVTVSCSKNDSNTENKADTKEQIKIDTNTNKDDKKGQTKADLSQKELDYFTKYFEDVNNNGFLLCNYNNPTELELEKVLYSGAGCDHNMKPITDAERNAYLKAVGEEEVYLDLHRITKEQINKLLSEKADITLSKVKKQLSWTYIKEYDTYYLEQGDSNYCDLKCVSGNKTSEGIYVIECETTDKEKQQSVNKCEVTLKKVGELYKFQSNVIKE